MLSFSEGHAIAHLLLRFYEKETNDPGISSHQGFSGYSICNMLFPTTSVSAETSKYWKFSIIIFNINFTVTYFDKSYVFLRSVLKLGRLQ